MRNRILILLLASFLFTLILAAAPSHDQKTRLKHTINGWNNHNFAFCYFNDSALYNLQSFPYLRLDNILDARVSPACHTFAIMSQKGSKRIIGLYSTKDGTCLHRFEPESHMQAINFALTADAKLMSVLYDNREIITYNLSTYAPVRKVLLPFRPSKWCISPNNYHLALAAGDSLHVFSYESGEKRISVRAGAIINDISFSPDNLRMGLLTANGTLQIYDTRTFTLQRTITGLGNATECLFHPDRKYVSVLTSPRKIVILNLKDDEDRKSIDARSGGITHIGLARSLRKVYYLVYNTDKEIIITSLDNLVPNYQQIVADRVDEEMNRWQKRRRDESTEEYHQRVNEDTRREKFAVSQEQVTNDLAEDVVGDAVVTIGDYDMNNEVLEIKFDILPPIYLNMTKEELAQMGNANDLIFENSRYSIDDKDNFELLYTEVTNRKTGKKYVYDKQKPKQETVSEATEELFVPLEIIRQSSIDEIRLETMKDSIMNLAMDSNLLSDKTHITVKTSVEPSVNDKGERTMNYNIDFSYFVEKEFSTRDDYKVGQYDCTQSEAAMAMLRCVMQAFANQFASYLVEGKKVLISLYGSADAIPISGKIKYDGKYGNFVDALVYDNGELGTVSVTRASGITTNNQLAFLRAASVRDYVQRNITALSQMATDYTYNISVSKESGSEYRRIGIRFTFLDAFK